MSVKFAWRAIRTVETVSGLFLQRVQTSAIAVSYVCSSVVVTSPYASAVIQHGSDDGEFLRS